MSERFKKKLQAYTEGQLSEQEHQEMEAELEKMEIYQEYLNEMTGTTEETSLIEQKAVKRGKKKSLMANVFNTIGAFIAIAMISSLITNLYFGIGSNTRSEQLREAVEVAVLTTMPNMSTNGVSSATTLWLQLYQDTRLVRTLGNERLDIGELSMRHDVFSRVNSFHLPWEARNNVPFIQYPSDENNPSWSLSAFQQLEQLPEGTMMELYLSFDRTMSMEEVFDLFRGRDVDIRWMAVERGLPLAGRLIIGGSQLGIPGDSYLLRRHWTIEEMEPVQQGAWTITGSSSFIESPQPFEGVEFREMEFLQALEIMQQHPQVTRNFYWDNFDESVAHIHEHGINIFGAVITGPRNALLQLRDEDWIEWAEVGQVEFLNWGNHWE